MLAKSAAPRKPAAAMPQTLILALNSKPLCSHGGQVCGAGEASRCHAVTWDVHVLHGLAGDLAPGWMPPRDGAGLGSHCDSIAARIVSAGHTTQTRYRVQSNGTTVRGGHHLLGDGLCIQ